MRATRVANYEIRSARTATGFDTPAIRLKQGPAETVVRPSARLTADGTAIDGWSIVRHELIVHSAVTSNGGNAVSFRQGAANKLVVGPGGSLDAFGPAVLMDGDANVLTNRGSIVSRLSTAVSITGNGSRAHNEGTLSGATNALFFGGADNAFDNAGALTSGLTAVYLNGANNTFRNTGTVEASSVGVRSFMDGAVIDNDGGIRGTQGAVELRGGASTLTNRGTMETASSVTVSFANPAGTLGVFVNEGVVDAATDGGTAVQGSAGVQKVTSSGIIRGSVIFGAGNDHLTILGSGFVTGPVSGGDGDDQLQGGREPDWLTGG